MYPLKFRASSSYSLKFNSLHLPGSYPKKERIVFQSSIFQVRTVSFRVNVFGDNYHYHFWLKRLYGGPDFFEWSWTQRFAFLENNSKHLPLQDQKILLLFNNIFYLNLGVCQWLLLGGNHSIGLVHSFRVAGSP